MSTIRVATRKRYTTVDRALVNDDRLSFRARGVLVWLLDKPDGWSVDSDALARQGKEGRDAIRAAFKELTEAGYLRRERVQGERGRWQTVTTVYEMPLSPATGNPSPVKVVDGAVEKLGSADSPTTGFPTTGGPVVGGPVVKDRRLVANTETDKTSPASPVRTPEWTEAHRLAVLAMEQRPKPVIKGASNPFAAVQSMILRQVEAGTPPGQIEAAILAGVDVWTTHGLQTAIARIRYHTPVSSSDRRMSRQEVREAANADAIRQASELWAARG